MEAGIGGQTMYFVFVFLFRYKKTQKIVLAFYFNLKFSYKKQNTKVAKCFKSKKQKTKTKLKFSTTYGKNYVSILYYVFCICIFNIHYVSSIYMMMFDHYNTNLNIIVNYRKCLKHDRCFKKAF